MGAADTASRSDSARDHAGYFESVWCCTCTRARTQAFPPARTPARTTQSDTAGLDEAALEATASMQRHNPSGLFHHTMAGQVPTVAFGTVTHSRALTNAMTTYRHRRWRVHCAGTRVPVLKMTGSPRRSFRVLARPYPRNRHAVGDADIEPTPPSLSAQSHIRAHDHSMSANTRAYARGGAHMHAQLQIAGTRLNACLYLDMLVIMIH